jgi:hypothetical protein
MVDEKLFETLARLRDGFNGMAMAIDELIQQQTKTVLKTYDTLKVTWQKADGEKGPYEKATEQDNENNNEYRALLDDLNQHMGKLAHAGLFYWLFQDNKTIGRKPQQKKA